MRNADSRRVRGPAHSAVQVPKCAPSVARAPRASTRPIVLYTDIQSGPTSGGENDLGVFLSIFGRNFGESVSPSDPHRIPDVRVTIGGHPVAGYRYVGPSAGRPDIQQITVQVGHLQRATQGVALNVEVERGGLRSTPTATFMPNPGTIYFVDNLTGDDVLGRANDVAHPFRNVQLPDPRKGLWPRVGPGDIVVMRGTGVPWQAVGRDGYFLRFQHSGTRPRGRLGTGPITVMSYPAEDVFINETFATSKKGAIAARSAGPRLAPANAARGRGASDPDVCEQNRRLFCSQWIVLSSLRVEGGGKDGAVDLETGGNHWRIVNNTLSASTADSSARSGGIAGDGLDVVILGNTVRDITSPDPGLQNHGIYIDGPGSYRIEYNFIHNVPGGSGFQIYGDQSATHSFVTGNLIFSHNWVDHVAKYCINLADNAGRRISASYNVLAWCGMAGLRVNSPLLKGAMIYNNTFYAADTLGGHHYGAIVLDSPLRHHALDVRNNIFVPAVGMSYMGGDAPMLKPGRSAYFTHNLYFGGAGVPTFDFAPLLDNPHFVNSEHYDFHLSSDSVARPHGSTVDRPVVEGDFDPNTTRDNRLSNLGAYGRANPDLN